MSAPLILHARVIRGAGGGPDKTILSSPRYLASAGYSTLCLYLRDPRDPGFADLEARALRFSAPLAAVDDNGPLDWRLLGRLKTLCREVAPAIWHAHDYKTNLLGLLLRRSLPMRLVTTVHGWVHRTWRTRLYDVVDRACLPRYEQVLCVSRDLHRACLELGVPAERCTFVPNAIDTEMQRRNEPVADAKARLGLAPGAILIGAVGRLSAEKGFDLLIQAVGELAAAGVDAHLWIAGEGAERDALGRLAGELGLAGRVRLLGFLPDPADLYQALDIFALSSRREGLPNVVLEAMAYEVPVVSTRVGGVEDLVRDGDNGVLIAPESVPALAAALGALAARADERVRLGHAGRVTVESRFSFRARMERVAAVYDRLLAEPAPAGGRPGAAH